MEANNLKGQMMLGLSGWVAPVRQVVYRYLNITIKAMA